MPKTKKTATAVAGKRILVVDDSSPTATSLARLLQGAGFVPTVFHKGIEALQHVRDNGTDAAVIDIHLPDINGLILSHQLRDCLGSDKPIIVLSGDTSMETLNSLPHVGATHFYSKPVNGSQLIGRLNELLVEPGAATGGDVPVNATQ
jgi:two-component system sensor histidine kinase RpfC